MKALLKLSLTTFLFLTGCQTASETKVETPSTQPAQAKTEVPKNEAVESLDVPKLANKSADELDKMLGKPLETKQIENGGEYRLYQIANQSKGLAVRFYGAKAKSFNLILESPISTSKEALKKFFNIDVATLAAQKDTKEPLSEVYQGTFGGVKFAKVSAKRQAIGKGFIFILAEIAN